jgi:two-component system cell cycle response regulator
MAEILLIEDDDATRNIITLALKSAGHKVLGVESAEEGFKALDGGSFDAVLMDIGLPGMSGVEACRRMKAAPATAKVPVVLVTVQSRAKAKVEGLDAGADDYVVKPVQPAVLLARVAALLRRFQKP